MERRGGEDLSVSLSSSGRGLPAEQYGNIKENDTIPTRREALSRVAHAEVNWNERLSVHFRALLVSRIAFTHPECYDWLPASDALSRRCEMNQTLPYIIYALEMIPP